MAEIKVLRSDPMPLGYEFLEKGNVFLTANCRRSTHAAGKPLYVVIGNKKESLGLRCPAEIIAAVDAIERGTREHRAAAVARKDLATTSAFRTAIRKEYPAMPADEVDVVVDRALQKHSGRVGRTSTLDVGVKARLALEAHIRHVHTDYDQLLRDGVGKTEARKAISTQVRQQVDLWMGGMGGSKSASLVRANRKPGAIATTTATATAKMMTTTTTTQTQQSHQPRLINLAIPHNDSRRRRKSGNPGLQPTGRSEKGFPKRKRGGAVSARKRQAGRPRNRESAKRRRGGADE